MKDFILRKKGDYWIVQWTRGALVTTKVCPNKKLAKAYYEYIYENEDRITLEFLLRFFNGEEEIRDF